MNIYNSHEKNELGLLQAYLKKDPRIFTYGQTGDISKELHSFVPNLRQCDSPDMYAIVGDTLFILEHFAFDASHESKNGGMEQLKKDRTAKAQMNIGLKQGKEEVTVLERVGVKLSFFDWQLNFENHFNSHYAKISKYIENANNEVKKNIPCRCLKVNYHKVGFFVEEASPPIVNIGKKLRELNYFETKQFLDFFSAKTLVDFILFGTYRDGHSQLIYVDHAHSIDIIHAVDLQSDDVSMSHINQNEISYNSAFQI